MSTQDFFVEERQQTEIKRTIVTKYFVAWAKIMTPRNNRIAYVDLFAGPGYFKDQTKSTPIVVLEHAIAKKDIRQKLVTIFNDKDFAVSLEQAIDALPGIKTLKHKPQVSNQEVDGSIVKIFAKTRFIPTLFFIDPWGYKGLSLSLVDSILKDWGCDCIFFFNYNRINMGLNNPSVKEHMDALFGADRADKLRQKLEKLDPDNREMLVVKELAEALNSTGRRRLIRFCFKNKRGNRTRHYLIFVSKHFLGYKIMNDIMARESSSQTQGVPSFEHNPAKVQLTLFDMERPLDDLEEQLLKEFTGRSLTVLEIFKLHSIDKQSYVLKNYKDALRKMEEAGIIQADPPANNRIKREGKVTMANSVKITFPKKGN